MPINSIDSPAFDIALREPPQVRARRNSAPAPAAAAAGGSGRDSGADSSQSAQLAKSPERTAAATTKQALPPTFNLKFSSDEETGKAVVALIDPVSGAVLRQVPTEEALEVAKAIGKFQGMFIDKKA